GPPPPTGVDGPPPLHMQIAPVAPAAPSGAEEAPPPSAPVTKPPAAAPAGPPAPSAEFGNGPPIGDRSNDGQSCNCDSCNCGQCECDDIWLDRLCGPWGDPQTQRLFDELDDLKCYDMTLTGWLNAGIMGNGRRTADHFNGPLTFADRRGEGQAN